MTRKNFLYAALAVLGIFGAVAFYQHFAEMPARYAFVAYEYKIPFVSNDRIVYVSPEVVPSGLKVGDRITVVNGTAVTSNQVFRDEIDKAGNNGVLNVTVVRGENGDETADISIPMTRTERTLNYYLRIIVGFIFVYIFPLFCFLFGFWVVLIRPTDYLAWLLLFLLWGMSAIGLEGFDQPRVLQAYKAVFGGSWALSMLLFGIYFPERLALDRKLPWLKFLLIFPLGYQVISILLGLLKTFTGLAIIDSLAPFNQVYYKFSMPLNMLSIGLFFACLGWKSGTLESPDARRRLKVMVVGTMVAMTPSFAIILYSLISGAKGSFFDVAPSWFALIALLLMLLFPLTMAYVIVVYRAMDVSVVIRQGLQYALASGGVRVIQLLLLLGIGLLVRWSINNYGFSFGAQIAFIVGGVALVPLVDMIAKPLKLWIDRRFFREAYDAEKILSDLSDDVRTMVEAKPLLETVAGKISESLHVPQVSLLLKNGQNYVPAYSLGFDTTPVVSLGGDSRAIRKLRDNRHIVLYDDMTEVTSVPTVSLDEREQLRELNTQVLLPVAVKDELTGIISLSPKRSEEPYTPTDMRLLRSVAAQTGLALENSRLTEVVAREAAQKERLNAELDIAREVQERLFPQELPKIEGLEYYGACRPALGVGGDYYDFLELPGGKFGIAIGDVSGKGIGASLMMASLQASLRGQALHSGDDIAGLMTHVNTLVYEASTTNRYATFFYAQYDPATRKLGYVNAGHNPPFLLRKNGGEIEVIRLEEGGAVVGMLPSILARYAQGEIELQAGDLLVGFTDGISESMNPAEEEWGEDAMLEDLKSLVGLPSRTILEHIVASADKFANGAKQHDDMTMIVVNVVGPQAAGEPAN